MTRIRPGLFVDRAVNCDLKISTRDGKVVEAHWVVLGRSLKYFDDVWRNDKKAMSDGLVKVDASYDAINFVLDWAYNNNGRYEVDTLKKVLKIAQIWGSAKLAKQALVYASQDPRIHGEPPFTFIGWAFYFDQIDVLMDLVKRANISFDSWTFEEIYESLKSEFLPSSAIWGALMILYHQLQPTPYEWPRSVSVDDGVELPEWEGFDITPYKDVSLKASEDGTLHRTCRSFLPDSLFPATNASIVEVEGNGFTIKCLVDLLNGEEVDLSNAVVFQSLYKTVCGLEFYDLKRLLKRWVSFFSVEDLEKMLHHSSLEKEDPKLGFWVVAAMTRKMGAEGTVLLERLETNINEFEYNSTLKAFLAYVRSDSLP